MRLIDADKLIEYISNNGVLGNYYSDNERENDVIDMIDYQPTAYDVSKVVESFDNLIRINSKHGYLVNKEDAINLVKGGLEE